MVHRNRRGQALVEYMLLLCSTMMVALVVGTLLKKQLGDLAERIFSGILRAAVTVVFG